MRITVFKCDVCGKEEKTAMPVGWFEIGHRWIKQGAITSDWVTMFHACSEECFGKIDIDFGAKK